MYDFLANLLNTDEIIKKGIDIKWKRY